MTDNKKYLAFGGRRGGGKIFALEQYIIRQKQEIACLRAENEALKFALESTRPNKPVSASGMSIMYENSIRAADSWEKKVKEIKADAIKEFAERLKEDIMTLCCRKDYIDFLVTTHIDNLVKEMEGNDNED